MRRRFLLLFIFALVLEPVLAATVWPDPGSDLPADPAIRRGTLPNGLHYLIRPNAEPKNRVSLRFLVAAGSLHERDDERGLAHFVEHMAFRGTRSHPNGSLASELQRRGIAFGPDNTAFTHYDFTIYHLELPDVTDASLRLGLSVFREYAEEITFAPELIERERGVILAEKDNRNTPEARSMDRNLAFLWPESRQIRRSPIGTEESIRQLRREQFVAFYDAWYRPERMAIIVVGEVSPERVEQLITEMLGPVTAHGSARDDLPVSTPAAASTPDIEIFTDPGLIGASCILQHPFADPRVPDTHNRRVEVMHRTLAFSMLQRRAVRLAERAESQPVAPSARLVESLPGWGLATFGGTGRITDWQTFMSGLEQEHRRAFLHGFTEEELRAAKLAFATGYEEAVRTSATWPSGWIATRLANALVLGESFPTPATVQQDVLPALEAATTAQCLAAFRHTWTTRAQHVFIATHPDFKVSAAEVATALNASRQQPVQPLEEKTAAEFAYTDFGPAGHVTSEQHATDLDVHQAVFTNGVRLNFKATPFEADTVEIVVRIGLGRLSQPEALPGLDLFANHMLPRGGLGRHTFEELQDILNGHRVSATFSVNSDAFEFVARCAPPDLRLCLQVITAHLTDAAYRPEALRHVHANLGSMYAGLGAAPSGPISAFAPRLLAGGDRRFGIPNSDEMVKRTIAELSAWLEPQFKYGAIELSIVGETTWPAAVDAVSATLAALPPRDPAALARPTGPVRIATPDKSMYVYTTAPQLRQVAIAWMIPMRELDGIRQERRCLLLAELLEERIRVRLRDELGATYACSASFIQHDGFPQFSYFSVFAEVSPLHAQAAARLMQTELDKIRKRGFTADEFARARSPFLRRREEDLRHNGYWVYTVLRDAQQRPERLTAARDRAADTAAITPREVEQIARRCFKPSKCFQFVSYPSVATTASR